MNGDLAVWGQRALCAQTGGDAFHPEGQGSGAVREARKVCAHCEVQRECLIWALANDPEGVWAGTTKRERRAMMREKAVAA